MMPGQTEAAQASSSRLGIGAGAKTLVYVVDDETMLLELAAIILEPLGYEVKTFRDPALAVEAFTTAQQRPALIITDYAMHRMNGMALIEACRKLEPKQKILLLSGTVGPEVYYNSACKPDHFLGKPYHAHELVQVVKSMLAT